MHCAKQLNNREFIAGFWSLKWWVRLNSLNSLGCGYYIMFNRYAGRAVGGKVGR